jgi:hypothetical protein
LFAGIVTMVQEWILTPSAVVEESQTANPNIS